MQYNVKRHFVVVGSLAAAGYSLTQRNEVIQKTKR